MERKTKKDKAVDSASSRRRREVYPRGTCHYYLKHGHCRNQHVCPWDHPPRLTDGSKNQYHPSEVLRTESGLFRRVPSRHGRSASRSRSRSRGRRTRGGPAFVSKRDAHPPARQRPAAARFARSRTRSRSRSIGRFERRRPFNDGRRMYNNNHNGASHGAGMHDSGRRVSADSRALAGGGRRGGNNSNHGKYHASHHSSHVARHGHDSRESRALASRPLVRATTAHRQTDGRRSRERMAARRGADSSRQSPTRRPSVAVSSTTRTGSVSAAGSAPPPVTDSVAAVSAAVAGAAVVEEEIRQCSDWINDNICRRFKTCPYFHDGVECEVWVEWGHCPAKAAADASAKCKGLHHRKLWAAFHKDKGSANTSMVAAATVAATAKGSAVDGASGVGTAVGGGDSGKKLAEDRGSKSSSTASSSTSSTASTDSIAPSHRLPHSGSSVEATASGSRPVGRRQRAEDESRLRSELERTKRNVLSMMRRIGKISRTELKHTYLEQFGEHLELEKHGFMNIVSFVRRIPGLNVTGASNYSTHPGSHPPMVVYDPRADAR